MKAVIISGFLYNLSDNIKPFLDKDTDVYVHTWDDGDNMRWVGKLNRYKKYCNELKVVVEKPKHLEKLHSYFYSTWKAFNLLDGTYEIVIKFKPNIDALSIPFRGNMNSYYKKAKIQCRPILSDTTIDDCIFGKTYYKTLDERIFSGTQLAFQKIFTILEEDLVSNMIQLDNELKEKYIPNYEGSIFWTEWFERKGIKIIEDTDLKISNNVYI